MSHVPRWVRYPHPKSQKSITKICITNWGKLVLQNETALFCYKLGQTLLQIGVASLLQIRASVAIDWAAITNLGKMYYKLEQVLQSRAIITNWGITCLLFNSYAINLIHLGGTSFMSLP